MTYEERVNRWRILRRDADMSEERKASYRLHGLDPDDTWSLIWSFESEAAARDMLARLETDAAKCNWIYKLVDGGKETTIKREAWL